MFLTACWYRNGWYGVSLFRPKKPFGAPTTPKEKQVRVGHQ
uniref:Uncharacterized protein n=1 Tax=Anguilla anguilla TaxID=7936 RepID=A0A0E9TRJ7_ANGAN